MSITAEAEKRKEGILHNLRSCGMTEERMILLDEVVEHLAFMSAKLDEAKDQMGRMPLVVSYNNGGGQKGIRENPMFKSYEALWKSYMQGVDKILSQLPQAQAREIRQEEKEKHATVLEVVRSRHNA